jgi:Rib/alpha/Esp surface antigen-like repeat protein
MKRIVKSLSAAALAALFLTGGLAGQAKAAREDAERYQPKVANKQVEVGNFRFADSFVKNKDQLPKETIFSFTETPDFYRAGSYRTRIIAAYPDWSQDKSKTFTVTVKEKQTDAQKYRPEAKGKTVKMGKSISPASLIKNRHSLPKGTNYSFSSRVNFKKAGSYKTRIALVYPDGSSESSKTIRIKVKDLRKDKEKYRPKVKKVKTAYGKVLYAYQAVTNWRKLPKGTTFSYTKAVNFWKSGKYKRRVLVQYPDKSSEKTSSFYLTVKRQPDNQKYGLRVKNASLWLGQKTTAKKLVPMPWPCQRRPSTPLPARSASRRPGPIGLDQGHLPGQVQKHQCLAQGHGCQKAGPLEVPAKGQGDQRLERAGRVSQAAGHQPVQVAKEDQVLLYQQGQLQEGRHLPDPDQGHLSRQVQGYQRQDQDHGEEEA